MTGRWGAVLFDMDGTLVDSEKAWYAALAELAATIGESLSPAARTAVIGTALTRAVQVVYDDLGMHGRDPVADIAWLEDHVHAHVTADGLQWRPGAHTAGATVLAVTSGQRLPTGPRILHHPDLLAFRLDPDAAGGRAGDVAAARTALDTGEADAA